LTGFIFAHNLIDNHYRLGGFMHTQYCFAFSALEQAVRHCDNSTKNLDIISCYVHMGLERAKQHATKQAMRRSHLRIFNTLVDTLCDSLVPIDWRKQCDTYIKRLQPLLFEILSADEYQAKLQELALLKSFFFTTSSSCQY
jgi:hypothetical protein